MTEIILLVIFATMAGIAIGTAVTLWVVTDENDLWRLGQTHCDDPPETTNNRLYFQNGNWCYLRNKHNADCVSDCDDA